MSRAEWVESDSEAIPEPEGTDVFKALASSRRRLAVLFLGRAEAPLATGTLADLITAVETGNRYENSDSNERKAVYVAMYQAHAEKLAEAGLATIDDRHTTFVPTERCYDEAERLAERLAADGPQIIEAVDRVLEEAGMAPWQPTVPDDVAMYRVPTGTQFRRLREKAGVNQMDVADAIGVSNGSISRFEREKSSLGADSLREAVEYVRRVERRRGER